MMSRAHIIVTGRVQGVSYRYFVRQTARRLGLTGRVKNLPDGRVEILLEGNRERIEDLIRELPEGNSLASVRHINTEWETCTGEFNDFYITS